MKKILIIGCEVDIAKMIRQRLESEYYKVIDVSEKNQRLETVKAARPALIIMNIEKSGMNDT